MADCSVFFVPQLRFFSQYCIFFFFFIVFNELCLCEAAILIHSLCVASLETKKN